MKKVEIITQRRVRDLNAVISPDINATYISKGAARGLGYSELETIGEFVWRGKKIKLIGRLAAKIIIKEVGEFDESIFVAENLEEEIIIPETDELMRKNE